MGEVRRALGGLEVELDRGGSAGPGLGDESRRRIDVARRADRDEEAGAVEGGPDPLHLQRHLAEPDHVRAQARRPPAIRATDVARQVLVPDMHGAAMLALDLEQLAMHVDEGPCAGALVQVVDVLGHHQDLARPLAFEPRQRQMGGVRLHVGAQQAAAALVVEGVHAARVLDEGLVCRDVLDPDLGPDAVRVAKGVEAGFL